MSTTLEIARLRWIAVILIAVDVTLTLIGQPGGFWNSSGAFKEANPFFAWFLAKGPAPFLALIVCYTAAVIWLVSVLPRRLGLITLMSFVFGHYFGASSWLMYHFRLGVLAPILYGVFLSICLIALGKEKNEPNKAPEPTSGTVTPPAEPGVAPVPPVAHL